MDNIEKNKQVVFKFKITPKLNEFESKKLFKHYFLSKYSEELTTLYLKIIENEENTYLNFHNKRELHIFLTNLFLVLNKISLNEEYVFTLKIKRKIYSFTDLTKPIKKIKEKFIFNNGFMDKENKNESNFFLLKGRNFIRKLKKNFEFVNVVETGEIFYDCNFPEPYAGYDIIEVDEDLYRYVKNEE